jgi:hypothetical protein
VFEVGQNFLFQLVVEDMVLGLKVGIALGLGIVLRLGIELVLVELVEDMVLVLELVLVELVVEDMVLKHLLDYVHQNSRLHS